MMLMSCCRLCIPTKTPFSYSLLKIQNRNIPSTELSTSSLLKILFQLQLSVPKVREEVDV